MLLDKFSQHSSIWQTIRIYLNIFLIIFSSFAIYYWIARKAPVHMPNETWFDVLAFLPPKQTRLWHTNRMFAIRLVPIRNWEEFIFPIRETKQLQWKFAKRNRNRQKNIRNHEVIAVWGGGTIWLAVIFFCHIFTFCKIVYLLKDKVIKKEKFRCVNQLRNMQKWFECHQYIMQALSMRNGKAITNNKLGIFIYNLNFLRKLRKLYSYIV